MAVHTPEPPAPIQVLTTEQDNLLDLYLQRLDDYLLNLKDAERVEVEIETVHLRRVLSSND